MYSIVLIKNFLSKLSKLNHNLRTMHEIKNYGWIDFFVVKFYRLYKSNSIVFNPYKTDEDSKK